MKFKRTVAGSASDPGQIAALTTGATLIEVESEPSGSNCPEGGQRIETGMDDDGSGTLESAEVDAVAYVCDGQTGPQGAAGADGQDGSDGAPGVDGEDGAAGEDGAPALIKVSEVQEGSTECPAGGQQFDAGIDDDGSGVLDASEIDSSAFVCNGTPGEEGPQGTDGAPGSDGQDGQPGADGMDGSNSLVEVTELESGHNICADGGQRVDSGRDLDGDGVLSDSEIESTAHVCDGASGGCSAASSSSTPSIFFWLVILSGIGWSVRRARGSTRTRRGGV